MRDLWEFCRDLIASLISRITGGILAVFLTTWSFYVKHAPPAWIWWGSLAIYFFLSAFGVWKKERQRANKAESSISDNESLETEKFKKIKSIVLGLPDWGQEALRELCMRGIMTDIGASEYLLGRKIIKHDQPLAELGRITNWLDRDPYGKYKISNTVEPDLRKVFAV